MTGLEAVSLLVVAGICLASLLFAFLVRLRRRKQAGKRLVVDGSNVMYWKSNTPEIDAVVDILRELKKEGFVPSVVFDANAGYLVSGKYRHHGDFARMLGLPEARVMVVPKGTPADPIILKLARDLGARIVTNDRFKDWGEDFPEIRNEGHLIRGGYRFGQVWFDQSLSGTESSARVGSAAV